MTRLNRSVKIILIFQLIVKRLKDIKNVNLNSLLILNSNFILNYLTFDCFQIVKFVKYKMSNKSSSDRLELKFVFCSEKYPPGG